MKEKRIFRIGQNYFWACNGRKITNCWWVSLGRSATAVMGLSNGSEVKVVFVDPPAGRCPHCGEKL